MILDTNEIHVWYADLISNADSIENPIALLDADEQKRAERFHFPIHKQRFIMSRYILRQILSTYLNLPPQEIKFTYSKYGKPSIASPNVLNYQFNLTHSDDIAVYAITIGHAIGVDIEKIKENYNPDVAIRFFSQQENKDLVSLPKDERNAGFYRIWSRKEALIKANGKGLSIPLGSFSVSANDIDETIDLENEKWTLLPLRIHPDYQAALATNQIVKTLNCWPFFDQQHPNKMSSGGCKRI